MGDEPNWLSTQDAARSLGITPRTLRAPTVNMDTNSSAPNELTSSLRIVRVAMVMSVGSSNAPVPPWARGPVGPRLDDVVPGSTPRLLGQRSHTLTHKAHNSQRTDVPAARCQPNPSRTRPKGQPRGAPSARPAGTT